MQMDNHFHLVWTDCVGNTEMYKIAIEHLSKFQAAQHSQNDIDLLLHYNSEVLCEKVDTRYPITLNGLVMFVRG
jgi:hypothetical protein